MSDRLDCELLLVDGASRKAAEPVAAPEPTADDYRRILLRARKEQLQATRANVQRLADTYDAAAKDIAERILALPEDRGNIEWIRAQFQLLRDIDQTLTNLHNDFGDLLDISLLDSAQMTAYREREVAAFVAAREDPNLFPSMDRTIDLTRGVSVTVQFGRLAESAVDAITTRVYRDGLRLSDRLYSLDAATRKTVEDIIIRGVAEGTSARDLAMQLRQSLIEAGAANPRYQAMRIARTEINNAHREAQVRSAIDPVTGATKAYITGLRWNLSLSHPSPDICDVWASGGSGGLPPGVYAPSDVPVDHPHGLCIPSGTRVAAPLLRGATSRWFVGEVIDIETVSGHFLTVTPNHPVLTTEGWVAARLLHEGGNVVCGMDAERIVALIDPYDHQAPAIIEDVVRSLRRAVGVSTARVPSTAEYFHGDGIGGKVHVVRTDRLLSNSSNSALPQPALQQPFCVRDADLLALARCGNLHLMAEGSGLAVHGDVRSNRNRLSPVGGHLSETKADAVGKRAYVGTVPPKELSDRSAGAAERGGNGFNDLAIGVDVVEHGDQPLK